MLIEVLQGFRTEKDFHKANELLMSLANMLDITIALKSVDNFRMLRKKEITIRKTIDTIIAIYCIENKLPLLHSDQGFQHFYKHLKLKNAVAGI